MSLGIIIVDSDRAAYTDLVEALERGGRSVHFRDHPGESADAALAIVDMAAERAETREALAPEQPLPQGTPFVAVAASDNAQTIRAAFARGALDVFVKPFSANEVAFKLERLLTTRQNPSNMRFMHAIPRGEAPDGLMVDEAALSVAWGDRPAVRLTPREFQILSLLRRAPDCSVTRPSIFGAVWSNVKVCQKVLDVHVSKLRKKLKPLGLAINFVRPNHYVLIVDPTMRKTG